MDEKQIAECIRPYVRDFIGVFACNERPISLTNRYYVLNTKRRGTEGEHWIAVNIQNGKIEVFDSLATFDQNTCIMKFINDLNFNTILYNKLRIQSVTSNVCGMYTVCFIIYRSAGMCFNNFLKLFNRNDFVQNDFLIVQMFKNLYLNHTFLNNIIIM